VYFVTVLLLMFVLPVSSMLVERYGWHNPAGLSLLAGRWFVFWSVGVRLVLAGIRQTANPRYTAETVLGLKTKEPWIVVRELGIANLAIGTVGLGSLAAGSWLAPAALAGAIFYGLAGINHVRSRTRNRLQTVAMLSDLFLSGVLLWYCLSVAPAGRRQG